MFNKFKIHPLQKERMLLVENYRQKREELDKSLEESMRTLQAQCAQNNHQREDGTSAWTRAAGPEGDMYCAICHKAD